MTGYVRVDTGNNIADGNVINATDLDNEFDGVQAAFNSSTGHTHDGTSGEGAPITKIGPVQDVVVSISAIYPKTTNTVDLGTSSLKYKDLYLAGNSLLGGTLGVTGAATLQSTLAVTGVATFTAQPILSSLTASKAVFSDASKGLVSNDITGTGNVVMSNSPTLVTPALGTPSSATLTNATGLPIATGVSGLGTGVATALAVSIGSAGAPVLFGGALGTPSSGTVTNLTGTASININGTVGATTATTGAFTTLTTSSTVTHNGGTANGVAYLNGSKVLTTGSALVFDGTNLGLGVSPSSWESAWKAFQFGALGSVAYGYGETNFGNNFYRINTGAYKYITTGEAAVYRQSGAVHSWGIAASGTAGNTISFTQAMTLDASGNLGVGTTSPNTRLHLQGASATDGSIKYLQDIFDTTAYNSSPQAGARVALKYDSGGNFAGMGGWSIAKENATDGNFASALLFHTRANGGNITERARIDSSGNLLVGGTSTAALDGVFGAVVGGSSKTSGGVAYESSTSQWATYTADSGQAYIFYDSRQNTERARINSSGSFMVGMTNFSGSFSNGVGFGITSSGYTQICVDSSTALAIARTVSTGNVQTFHYGSTTTNSTGVGSISVNGSATAYNTTSDYRLKNITGPVTGAKDFIMALKPKQGTWKIDGSKFVGFVAHEFQEVSPSSVIGEKDAIDKDGNPIMQAMQASTPEVMANLVALLQEQQAIIESLKARLDAANL